MGRLVAELLSSEDPNLIATENKDDLGYFLRLANDSCDEVLGKHEECLVCLDSIDRLFVDYIPGLASMTPAAASILLINAHASFRAAVRLAFSGQILPVFMVLRGCIESALYANAMVVNQDLQDVWLSRDADEHARKKCRNEFSTNKIFGYLEKAHDAEFSTNLKEVYETTIDFGAHPNNRSLLSSVRIEEMPTGESALNFAYIHGSDSFELKQSLVACAESGLAIFFVFLICFDKHPLLSDLNQRALELQGKIPDFISSLGLSVMK